MDVAVESGAGVVEEGDSIKWSVSTSVPLSAIWYELFFPPKINGILSTYRVGGYQNAKLLYSPVSSDHVDLPKDR